MLELELRNCPAPLIPGWDGPEQVVYGRFDTDNFADKAVVALEGGSARVMVLQNPHGDGAAFDVDREWPVLLNTIVFDPNFRGGGRVAVIPASLDAGDSEPDALLVASGPGGGPVLAKFDFASGRRFDFLAPYEADFRGGLWVSSGDIDGDRRPEALLLPRSGGSPRLIAIDMRTYETEASIFVGDPQDTSGRARFEPTGGTISKGVELFFYVQYGEVVENHAESSLIPVPRR